MPKRLKNKSKTTNTRAIVLAFLITIVVLLSIFAWYVKKLQTSEDQAVSTATQPTFLYVQTAHSGSLSPEGVDGKHTLTLNDVSPVTVYFSDRPDRETGHESTAEFIAEWGSGEDSFAKNPPNAALDIIGDDSQSIAIVELMSAQYDVQEQILEYQVLILDDETGGQIPEKFDEVALFIDSSHKDYYCGCEVEHGESTCECRYDYRLGKSKTKEFRGYCEGESVIRPSKVAISGKNKATSCTSGFHYESYMSRSCTNWSPTSSDHFTVVVKCSNKEVH